MRLALHSKDPGHKLYMKLMELGAKVEIHFNGQHLDKDSKITCYGADDKTQEILVPVLTEKKTAQVDPDSPMDVLVKPQKGRVEIRVIPMELIAEAEDMIASEEAPPAPKGKKPAKAAKKPAKKAKAKKPAAKPARKVARPAPVRAKAKKAPSKKAKSKARRK